MNKFDKPMMETALAFSKLSRCTRAKTGAVIAKDNRVVATGYNGLPPKADDSKSELICPSCQGNGKRDGWASGTCDTCQGKGIITNPAVQHAERNSLDFCAKNGLSTNGCTLYVTLSPCIECAKSIITAGIKRVVYLEKYRKTDSLNFLREYGVIVEKYNEYI